MKVLDNLEFKNSAHILSKFEDFPENPKSGMIIFKNNGLFIYAEDIFSGKFEWLNIFDLTKKNASFVYIQETPALEWTINHNLNTKDLFAVIYNSNDKKQIESDIEFIDNNNIKIIFSEQISGKAILFGTAVNAEPANIYTKEQIDNLLKTSEQISTDHVLGVQMIGFGGGSGTWVHINQFGKYVNTSTVYFYNHPIYSNIKEEIIDDQYMIKIPKFYYKNEDHRKIWISPTKVDDTFEVHPAFMKDGHEIDAFWIGKYQGTNEGNNKVGSQPGKAPWVNVSWTNFKTYCANRNTDEQSGWMMLSYYQQCAIAMLFLVEYATTNAQAVLGRGRCDTSSAANTDAPDVATATYRGIVGWYGNVWQCIDGIDVNNYKYRLWDNQGNKTWVNTNITCPAYGSGWNSSNSGYVLDMQTGKSELYDLGSVFIPKELSLTYADGTYSDYFNGSNGGNTITYFGGTMNLGSKCGCFLFFFWNAASKSDSTISVRLAKE